MMPIRATEAHDLSHLRQQPLWQALSATQQEQFLAQGQWMDAAPHTLLLEQDTPLTHLYIVLSGQLRLSRGHENGRDLVVDLAGPGALLGVTSLFTDGHSPMTVHTQTACTLFALPAKYIETLSNKNAAFASTLVAYLAKENANRLHQLSQITLHSAEERLGTYILNHMLTEGDAPHDTTLPASKTFIAQHLGITPETLSRTLAHLRQQGIAVDQNRVSLAKQQSMCPYCDAALARRCRYGTQADCPLNRRQPHVHKTQVRIQ